MRVIEQPQLDAVYVTFIDGLGAQIDLPIHIPVGIPGLSLNAAMVNYLQLWAVVKYPDGTRRDLSVRLRLAP